MSLSGIIIGITGYVLWIAAGLFDATLNSFVLQMGSWINGTAGSTGIGIGVSINVIWTIVRDLVNLTFIFGLVYVGFKTILDAGTDTKKLLSQIIICALLVNFSLFISKIVIDVSNVTASEIYKASRIGDSQVINKATGKQLTASEIFMSQMGILQLYSPTQNTQAEISKRFADAGINTTDGLLAFVVGASIFILVAAFVFAAGAILLAIRFGVLVILMMLSPIAFAAWVFPVFKGYSEKWFHALFSQAFFAPAYLFMIYVTLKVAEGYASQTHGFDKIFTSTNDTGFGTANFATAVFFCLTIVMMVASLILAKQMGAVGAAKALAVGKKTSAYVGNRVRSYAGRNTLGWIAEKDIEGENRRERSKTGRFFNRALTVGTLGLYSKRTRLKVAENLKSSKFGGSYSRADDIAFKKEQKQVRSREERKYQAEQNIKNGQKVVERLKAGNLPATTPADIDAIKKLTDAIRDLTDKELTDRKVEFLSNENVAINLNSRQIEAIEKSDNFTPDEVARIKKARNDGLVLAASRTSVPPGTAPATFGDVQGPATLARRGENELSKMPIGVLTESRMAQHLTPNIIEHIIKEGRADGTELATLKSNIQIEAAIQGPGPYSEQFKKWTNGNNVYGTNFGLTGLP